MRFPSALLAPIALAALVVPLGLACSTTSPAPTLTPLTGILIPAADLTRDRGCGAENGKLLKYAAVVSAESALDGGSGAGVAKGVYDCFADALFTNLPYGSDGTARYVIEIRAFGSAEYEAQKSAIDDLSADLPKFRTLRGARFTCLATMRLDVVTKAICAPETSGPAPVPEAGTPDAGDAGHANDAGDAGDGAPSEAGIDAATDATTD